MTNYWSIVKASYRYDLILEICLTLINAVLSIQYQQGNMKDYLDWLTAISLILILWQIEGFQYFRTSAKRIKDLNKIEIEAKKKPLWLQRHLYDFEMKLVAGNQYIIIWTISIHIWSTSTFLILTMTYKIIFINISNEMSKDNLCRVNRVVKLGIFVKQEVSRSMVISLILGNQFYDIW